MLRLFLDPSVNAKAWYLWCFASYVAVGPFLNVFFKHKGLSKAQVGLIGALRPWVNAPASFAWAAAADRLNAHRAVLLVTFAGAVAVRMLLLLPRGFGGLLAVALLAEVLAAPAGVLADAAVMQICQKESDYGKYRLWGAVGWGGFSTVAGWLMSNLGIRWAFYTQAVLTVPCLFHGARLFGQRPGAGPDGHCQHPHHNHHRGAAAAAAAAAAAGGGGDCGGGRVRGEEAANEHGSGADDDDDDFNEGGGRDVEEAAPLLAPQGAAESLERRLHRAVAAEGAEVAPGGGAASAAAGAEEATHSVRMGHAAGSSGGAAEEGPGSGPVPDPGSSFWRRLWALLRRWEVLLFFIIATVMGYGFGTIDSFLFLYLEDMGASGTLMGLTLTITCAAEVPSFQLQDRLLDAWGVAAVLDLVMAVYALRLALYAALPAAGSVVWVLPVEVLHGVTFACGWGAGTVNCKLLAPPELAATLQGAFTGLYFGVGYGLGSLVGGWVGSQLGWQGMFACAAATMLTFWVATLVARRVLRAFTTTEAGGKSVELVSPAAHAYPDAGSTGC